ncbi:NAD(P)H-dependent glycerol-3-phosphate dehydrogenase [Propionibacterium sp.]|uniref:NAD(P)H-dependent glycerol-3-phosphate dehydrogenase n=1 Tax=Propionibacterium sp. TaxID=1977903 RepID=UPI0039E7526E
MPTITILGAGAMGAAQCRPLVDAGCDVRLWGSRFDDATLDLLETGKAHPRTGVPVPEEVKLFRPGQIGECMEGTDVVVMALLSSAVPRTTRRILKYLGSAESVWLTSKGFSQVEDGRVRLMSETLRRVASETGSEMPPIVTIAGPVIANECATGRPTAPVFACHDISLAQHYARTCSTPVYVIEPSGDEVGVEVCAPLKNLYAIALGIAEGLGERDEVSLANLRAALFVQALREMSAFGQDLGGDEHTAFGLAGAGDLEVTGRNGRNYQYGLRIGRGATPVQARDEMLKRQQSVEGIVASRLALLFAEQLDDGLLDKLPLMKAVGDILIGRVDDYLSVLSEAVLHPVA